MDIQSRVSMQRASVLFDSQCGVCRSGTAMLARLDTGQRFEFLSLDCPTAASLVPGNSREELFREMHVVDPDGSVYSGAEAVRVIALRVPSLWWSIPYLFLPGSLPMWRRLYAAVARRRYQLSERFGCDGGTCAVHLAA